MLKFRRKCPKRFNFNRRSSRMISHESDVTCACVSRTFQLTRFALSLGRGGGGGERSESSSSSRETSSGVDKFLQFANHTGGPSKTHSLEGVRSALIYERISDRIIRHLGLPPAAHLLIAIEGAPSLIRPRTNEECFRKTAILSRASHVRRTTNRNFRKILSTTEKTDERLI